MEVAIAIVVVAWLLYEFHAWAKLDKKEKDR